MAEYVEGSHAEEFIISEAAGTRSRSIGAIGASQTLGNAAIVGLVSKGTGALTATAGSPVSGEAGTPGNGAVGSLTADSKAKLGDWKLVINKVATNLGTGQVFDPDGKLANPPTFKVGVAYNGVEGLNFTLGDGSNDWQVGDYVPITVAPANATGDDTYKRVDLTDDNGLEVAAGIVTRAVTTGASETAQAVLITRDAEVNGALLEYPSGASDDDKATINGQLADLGIIVRTDDRDLIETDSVANPN